MVTIYRIIFNNYTLFMHRNRNAFNTKSCLSVLDNFLTKLDKIPNLNYGGCVYSALSIYTVAKALELKPRIVFLYKYYETERLKSNRIGLKNNLDEFTGCYHAVVKIKDNYYDSNGIYTIDVYLKDIISYEKALAAFNKTNVWNYTFDRKNIKKIDKLTYDTLSLITTKTIN